MTVSCKTFMKCSIVGIALVVALAASAEDKPPAPQPPPSADPSPSEIDKADFLQLADWRARIQSELENLNREAQDLQRRRPEAEERLRQINETEAQIKEITASKQPGHEKLLESKRDALRAFREGLVPESLGSRIADINVQIRQKSIVAGLLQRRISSFLGPEHLFKMTMSGVFAALIGSVIIGFFVVALKDREIRLAIFAGEAGIQFVTLFSLVIAIILFGITQILEGKELAALLGGLSGYILGRSTPKSPPSVLQQTSAASVTAAATPQTTAPPYS